MPTGQFQKVHAMRFQCGGSFAEPIMARGFGTSSSPLPCCCRWGTVSQGSCEQPSEADQLFILISTMCLDVANWKIVPSQRSYTEEMVCPSPLMLSQGRCLASTEAKLRELVIFKVTDDENNPLSTAL